MKKLIDINKFTWSKVKQFATIKDCNLCVAVDLLLSHALNSIDILEKGGKGENEFANRLTQ